jgi:hypothetical protein
VEWLGLSKCQLLGLLLYERHAIEHFIMPQKLVNQNIEELGDEGGSSNATIYENGS